MEFKEVDSFYYRPALEVRALAIKEKFDRLLEEKLIDERNLRGKVLDIGVGYGGSYSVLSKFSNNVVGIEPEEKLAEMLVRYGIVERDKLVVPQPLDYLKFQKNGTFDFIAGLLLSPENYAQIEQLYKESFRILKDGGELLFTAEADLVSSNYFRRLEELLHSGDILNNSNASAVIFESSDLGQDDISLIVTKLKPNSPSCSSPHNSKPFH